MRHGLTIATPEFKKNNTYACINFFISDRYFCSYIINIGRHFGRCLFIPTENLLLVPSKILILVLLRSLKEKGEERFKKKKKKEQVEEIDDIERGKFLGG